MDGTLHRRGVNLAVAAATLAALCVVGEIVLRAFFPIAYSMDIRYVPDGHLGWRLEPDHRYRLASGGVCSINNLGYRYPRDLDVDKPGGSVRVVVLGGSAAFCYEVDDADTWAARLEVLLRGRYGDDVDVINAGVPGYDASASLVNYFYRAWALDPDVVLVYHTWNDLKLFHVIESGHLRDKEAFVAPNRLRKLLRHSQLAWRVRGVCRELLQGDRRENAWGDGEYASIPPEGRAHRWARRNFDDLALVLEKDGVVPVFASQAGLLSRDNVGDPAIRGLVRNDYARLPVDEVLQQWEAMTTIIAEAAYDNGVLFVDAYRTVPHKTECFHDHVHLTEEGNRYVAEAFYARMIADPAVDAALRRDPR
jgi:hypothetical protein